MEQPSNYSGTIPAINRQPPSASPWSSNNDKRAPMTTSVFGGTFYNDSSDNLGQISPGFAPGSGMNFPEGDDRRPSIASATTVSSTGSKSSASGKFHKKLQGFFGEEYNGLKETSRQGSEASSLHGGNSSSYAQSNARNRNNSVNNSSFQSGPPSPSSSRPRTPAAPSSEVTPWVYQDTQVRHMNILGCHCQENTDTRAAGHARRS
jgi:adenylate cyclase